MFSDDGYLPLTEQWRDYPGWEGLYGVSDLGRVRGRDGRILKGSKGAGYRLIRLCRVVDGVAVTEDCYVHDMVLRTFTGPKPAGAEARHGPGGKLDNRWPDNLCYGSRIDNQQDRFRDGTDLQGEKHPLRKLTDDAVREIRRRRAAGEKLRVLATDFSVTTSTIARAALGNGWKHVS